jgi:hypothetical protein
VRRGSAGFVLVGLWTTLALVSDGAASFEPDKRVGILFGVGIGRCFFLHPWVVDDGGSSSSLQTGPLSLLYRIPRASREGHRHSSSGSTFSLCSVLELYLFVRCESTLVSTCHVALLI